MKKALEIASRGIIKIEDLESIGYKNDPDTNIDRLADANYWFALTLIETAEGHFKEHRKDRFKNDGQWHEWKKGRSSLWSAVKWTIRKWWY